MEKKNVHNFYFDNVLRPEHNKKYQHKKDYKLCRFVIKFFAQILSTLFIYEYFGRQYVKFDDRFPNDKMYARINYY